MSDETHDHGEPYRNAIAGADCLNRPPRSREAAALDVALSILRVIATPTPDPETGLEKLCRLSAQTALNRIAIILGVGPKS